MSIAIGRSDDSDAVVAAVMKMRMRRIFGGFLPGYSILRKDNRGKLWLTWLRLFF